MGFHSEKRIMREMAKEFGENREKEASHGRAPQSGNRWLLKGNDRTVLRS